MDWYFVLCIFMAGVILCLLTLAWVGRRLRLNKKPQTKTGPNSRVRGKETVVTVLNPK